MIFLLTISKATYWTLLGGFGLIAAFALHSEASDPFGKFLRLSCVVLGLGCGYTAFQTRNQHPSKALERQRKTPATAEDAQLQSIEERLQQKFKSGSVTGQLFGSGSKGIHVQKTNQYYQVLPEIRIERTTSDSITATFSYEIRQYANAKALSGGTPQIWEKEFIDYPTGSYLLAESSLTLELMGGVRYAINQELRPYLEASNEIRIRLTGWADAQPISAQNPLVYKGEYPNPVQYYYLGEQLAPIPFQLSAGNPIPTNEILAVTRTLGARDFLEKETELIHFKGTKSYQNCAIADKNKEGGAYRKVQVRLELQHPFPSNPTTPNPPTPTEKPSDCWACKPLAVWQAENLGILTILLGLLVWHHKKSFKDDKYRTGRNVCGVLFLILTALTAYCFY
jgi:hypothetical protein